MGARILIIEDNPTNLDLLKFLLEAYGHNVTCATDGDDGLRLAEESVPDLIICDLHLPRFDGFQVAKQLKARAELRSIPLIAVTAFAMPADREKSLSAGYDGYFAKPIQPETFVGDLEQYLPRSMRSQGVYEQVIDKVSQQSDAVSSPHQEDAPPENDRGTVLVVDDSPTNRELVRLVLEPSGYCVIMADNTTEAIKIATTQNVDLILSDLHMPQSSGLDLLRELRTHTHAREIPVIMFSSTSSGHSDPEEVLAMGAAGFITRPIEPQELATEIEQCLRKAAHRVSSDE